MRALNLKFLLLLVVLAIASLAVGSSNLRLDSRSLDIVLISRLPRTLALILAGVSLSIAGVILQQLARNKFVEPTTTGTVEAATFGMLMMLIFFPQSSVFYKLLAACVMSLIGTAVFMLLLKKIQIREGYAIPLIGIIYGGVISAIITFIALKTGLLQSIWIWTQGDFSMVIQGRYELLWGAAFLSILAYLTADKLTIAGFGQQLSTSLGLNYKIVSAWGLILVSLITGITVVNSGVIPFLGLIVPNVVSLMVGDHLRRSLPLIALLGAVLILFCDLLARLINYPYEIPVGIVMGVFGSAVFLYLLFKSTHYVR